MLGSANKGEVMSVNNINNTENLKNKFDLTDLKVFYHHIYEYKKGIRNLILTTEKSIYEETIKTRLKNENIDYLIQKINDNKINVFFGKKECVKVVESFSSKLYELSAEEDFMLGIMLGYDRLKQCERYLKIKNNIILFKSKEKK